MLFGPNWPQIVFCAVFKHDMLTIVIGQTGTAFRAPAEAVQLDDHFDFDRLDAFHVAFSLHKLILGAVTEYILKRLFERKPTTVYVWTDEVHLVEHLLPHAAHIVHQHDTCQRAGCMQDAAVSYMRSDGVWFPLCAPCRLRIFNRSKK